MSKQNKKIAIIAPTGMLGSGVYNVLKDKYNLVLVYRDEEKIKKLNEAYGGIDNYQLIKFDFREIYSDYLSGIRLNPEPKIKKLFNNIGEIDKVINCAGIINVYATKDPAFTFFLNGALPHLLSEYYGNKLIQITTDCAFNGVEGYPYDETSLKSPVDIYGLSKILGEPKDKSLVIRTSIIGPEITDHISLLDWFRQQEGKTTKGFANHFWNGITTKQFGKICDEIISHPERYPETGLYHVFSTTVSKYEMLLKFKEKYNIDCEIKKDEEQKLNRTLTTIHDLNEKLNIPSFDEMIEEL
ncbi:MAG: sugar nucleotide-binding protein [Candidatus Pacebacteria bacterium]|nr:sugar nucleotide-binding protein [Candidatus Paceibacterota bacterium]